jgi:hypothetical protein
MDPVRIESACVEVPPAQAAVLRIPGRPLRVAMLVAAVAVLSLVDLVLTLTFILEIGLIEDNPIARALLGWGGPAMLVVWKVITAGFATTVLFWARRHAIAEVAAIFGAIVMIWLTARWVQYIETSAQLSSAVHEMEALGQGGWVTHDKGT